MYSTLNYHMYEKCSLNKLYSYSLILQPNILLKDIFVNIAEQSDWGKINTLAWYVQENSRLDIVFISAAQITLLEKFQIRNDKWLALTLDFTATWTSEFCLCILAGVTMSGHQDLKCYSALSRSKSLGRAFMIPFALQIHVINDSKH